MKIPRHFALQIRPVSCLLFLSPFRLSSCPLVLFQPSFPLARRASSSSHCHERFFLFSSHPPPLPSPPSRVRNYRLNGYARPGVCAQVTTPVVVVRKGVARAVARRRCPHYAASFPWKEGRTEMFIGSSRRKRMLRFDISSLSSDRPLEPRLLVSSLPVLFSFLSLPKIPSDTYIIHTHTHSF